MKKALANIITTAKKIKFDLPINCCSDMVRRDEKLPTLIIGYENAKHYIDGFNILKRYYPNSNIYWTFKRTENSVAYEEDIETFYKDVINGLCDGVKYQFINFIGLKISTVKKLINFVKSTEEKIVFNENNKFLYVYCEKYKTVFGFSLSTCEFFGIKPQKIMKLFANNINNKFVYDFTNIPLKVKQIVGEKFDKYMVLHEYFM